MLDCALKIKTSNSGGKARIWIFSFWWSNGMTNVSTEPSPTGIMAT